MFFTKSKEALNCPTCTKPYQSCGGFFTQERTYEFSTQEELTATANLPHSRLRVTGIYKNKFGYFYAKYTCSALIRGICSLKYSPDLPPFCQHDQNICLACPAHR